MRWVAAICIIGLLLAGCTEEAAPTPAAPQPVVPTTPPSEDPGIPVTNETETSVFPITYSHQDCEAIVFIHAVDFATANQLLPLGYTAADMGYLMDLPANINLAAIGLITYTCQEDDLGVGAHTQAALSVFINAPVLEGVQASREEVFINVYELHRFFSDDAQAARYQLAGWNVTTGLTGGVSNVIAPPADLDDHRLPQPGSGASEGILNGTQQWIGGVSGATGFRLKHEQVRFWQETPDGVSMVGFTLDKHGRGAVSLCQYAEGSLIAQTIGRTSCQPGENFGLTVSDFNVVGTIEHFPGVSA
ncbi:MAG: hypothetical protein ACPHID_01980 [Thermoplasmatota archaeon]